MARDILYCRRSETGSLKTGSGGVLEENLPKREETLNCGVFMVGGRTKMLLVLSSGRLQQKPFLEVWQRRNRITERRNK